MYQEKESAESHHATGRKMLTSIIEKVLAVEKLQYHDKNLLAGNDGSRSEWMQAELAKCLDILKRFEI